MKRKQGATMMLRLVAALALSVVLAACGGGSDAASGTSTSGGAGSGTGTVTKPTGTSSDPLAFSASNYSIAQAQQSVILTVVRSGSASAAVSVDYSTVDGTARAGIDYTATTGTLQWAADDATSKTITVPISNAVPFTGNKMFQVSLSGPSSAAEIVSPDIATVTISGGAQSAPGSLQLADTAYSVAQSTTGLTVTVNRVGGSSGAVAVSYSTANGTAVAGTDYTAASGTLTWTDGDAGSKTFTVAVSNATPFTATKTFTVNLTDPTGGATLGSASSATATITGDATASAGSLSFDASAYPVGQGTSSVVLTVDRTGGSNGAVSVSYASGNGTAVAGQEFTSAQGTVSWAAGDSAPKTISVAISNSAPFTGAKSFTVALSSPVGGVTIGNPDSTTVTITGDAVSSAAAPTFSPAAGTYTGTQSVSLSSATSDAKIYYTVDGSTPTTNSTLYSNVISVTASETIKAIAVVSGYTNSSVGSASYVISSGGGSGGPAAPTNVTLTAQTYSSQTLTWSAAVPGAHPVASYNIYRSTNGGTFSLIGNTGGIGTTYTDSTATNSNMATNGSAQYGAAATMYAYKVSAVDTSGTEGALQSQVYCWLYHKGALTTTNGNNNYYDFSNVAVNYADTSGSPQNGASHDVSVPAIGTGQYWQPFSQGGLSEEWALELGGFKYMTIDLKPMYPGQTWQLNIISRATPGDVFNYGQVFLGGTDATYGPPSQVGVWATYKVPFGGDTGATQNTNTALQMGTGTFYGYIAGTTLTVTSVVSGINIEPAGFISGNGVAANTYLPSNADTGRGGPGTYTVSTSQNVGSAANPVLMTIQRTNMYKFSVIPQQNTNIGSNAPNGTGIVLYYADNIGWVTE